MTARAPQSKGKRSRPPLRSRALAAPPGHLLRRPWQPQVHPRPLPPSKHQKRLQQLLVQLAACCRHTFILLSLALAHALFTDSWLVCSSSLQVSIESFDQKSFWHDGLTMDVLVDEDLCHTRRRCTIARCSTSRCSRASGLNVARHTTSWRRRP